ncbi:ROK family protein [Nanoarchaeota archaeon]
MKYIIGVDVGGTAIRSGLVTQDGRIISRVKVKTETKKGQKAVINNIVKAITPFLDHNDIVAVGLGVPGLIDLKKGIVKYSPNLPLKNTNIAKIIGKKVGKPVCVENDANCFTLGEARCGAAKDARNVIGLTLGTGIGSGLIIKGKLFHGKGSGAELGHMTINFKGPQAKCGNNGCIESYVSIRGIISRTKGMHVKNPKELFELAEQGNKKAIKVWKETGFYLGVGIANFINIFDPEVIVLGGNIANAWKFFHKDMIATIKKRALIKDTKVLKSKLGEDAGILGAASLCFS